jgi:exonuclease I
VAHNNQNTLYWHDYETWGENPAQDRPSQFAGVRTDENLNVLGEPLMLYCQPSPDFLPKPDACLVTGLSPQKAVREGVPEREFIAAIAAEQQGTSFVTAGAGELPWDTAEEAAEQGREDAERLLQQFLAGFVPFQDDDGAGLHRRRSVEIGVAEW